MSAAGNLLSTDDPYIDLSHTRGGSLHQLDILFPRLGIPAALCRIHGCDACRAGWLAEFPEEERARAAEAMQLFKDANRMLAQLDGDFHTHVRFGLYPACSDGDDLLLTAPEQEGRTLRLALLRQQHTTKPDEPYLCLSDFVRPLSQGISDTVGVFAATVDADMEHLYETGAYADDFKHLLAQTLSDRLAEASTEKMHQEVRTTYWGYAKDEQWSIEDLLVEKFTGIRPAFPAGPVCQLRAVGMVGVSGNRYPADRKRSHGAACFGKRTHTVPSLRTLLCHRKNRGRPVGRLCSATRPARGNDAQILSR